MFLASRPPRWSFVLAAATLQVGQSHHIHIEPLPMNLKYWGLPKIMRPEADIEREQSKMPGCLLDRQCSSPTNQEGLDQQFRRPPVYDAPLRRGKVQASGLGRGEGSPLDHGLRYALRGTQPRFLVLPRSPAFDE